MNSFFSCLACCGKRLKNADLSASQFDDLSSEQNRVLCYFTDYETKMLADLKQIPAEDFIKEAQLLAHSYDDSMSTRQLSIIYQKFDFQFTSLITVFAQEFFFRNQLGAADYDATKMYLFNLMYCQGAESKKLALLYDIICGENKALKPIDEHVIRKLEYLIMIPTFLLSNIIEQQSKFTSADDKIL